MNWLNTSTGSAPAYKFVAGGSIDVWLPSEPGYNAQNLFHNSLSRYFLPSIDEWVKAGYYDPVAHSYYVHPTASNSVPDGIDFPGDPAFDAVFANGSSNSQPNDIKDVGLLSPFGTAGQGGNVPEWHETALDRINDSGFENRSFSVSDWRSPSSSLPSSVISGALPTFSVGQVGLRVASSVPEPGAIVLIALGLYAIGVARPRG